MNWESPKLSKNDIEVITMSLDEYIYYSKQDGMDVQEEENILIRLMKHLEKY